MSKKSGLNYIQWVDNTNNPLSSVTTWAGTCTNHEHLNFPFEGIHVILNNIESNKEFIPTKVIFNPPATICFFPDGSKVVVKCADDEEFCEEEGVMACIIKKIFKSRNLFKKLVKNAYRQPIYGKDQWG